MIASVQGKKIAPSDRRLFEPELAGRWIGNGISYGPYRDGEGPELGSMTSHEHLLQDLQLISNRWNLIRLYGSGPISRRILEVIGDNDLPIRVMQGAWLSGLDSEQENREQIEQLIQLANDFPQIVVVANVGNEIFVDWSAHRMKNFGFVVEMIRRVRAEITQPVTVNDDYNFWNKPHARQIAAEVDFIGLQAYAFWNDRVLDAALEWTVAIYQDIQARFPDHVVAYCETGWPTNRVYDDSYEGGLIGKAGEYEQKTFFDQYNAWVDRNKIISLYFEAFDEQWKGGFDGVKPMDKAEKHWGLYHADRTPKIAIR